MLSIRENISELDRFAAERDSVVESYRTSLDNVAHYAVELDEPSTSNHRRNLTAIAKALSFESLRDTTSTVRALLREYQSKGAEYLRDIRDQLASTAGALEAVMESLAQTDGDADTRMRTALGGLREAAEDPAAAPIRDRLLAAANAVGKTVEEMRKQHQAHVAQFMTEVRMLHQRIGQLESAATIDSVTQLLTRSEIEKRIQSVNPANVHLLLLITSGIRLTEVRYNGGVAAELAGAFVRRLRNVLPPNAGVGRWSSEEFVSILDAPGVDAVKLARTIDEQISGTYTCLLDGKVVRPELQVRVAVLEPVAGAPERLLAQVREYMTNAVAIPA